MPGMVSSRCTSMLTRHVMLSLKALAVVFTSNDFALGEILPIIIHLHVAVTVFKENYEKTNHWEPEFRLQLIRSSQMSTSTSRRFVLRPVAGISSFNCLVANLHELMGIQIQKKPRCHIE
jgi:hypothetical protein